MSATFAIVRVDGRSNAQVILDYVKGHEPGRIYPYSELADLLGAGTDRSYDIPAVRGVVVSALPRLLREQQRTMNNVRGQGYRLAFANEHIQLALARKHKADNQMRMSRLTMIHTRLDEMDATARERHQGTYMLIAALYSNQVALERRQRASEDAIARLTKRVDRIDPQ